MDANDFRRWFVYDAWANAEILRVVRAANPLPERALELLAHIAAAQRLWYERLQGDERPATPVWPKLTAEQCEAELQDLARTFQGYVASATPQSLASSIRYVNTRGEPFTSAVADVLQHVIMHGAYHRGQVAITMRANGFEPAYTDFIHAPRQGFVD